MKRTSDNEDAIRVAVAKQWHRLPHPAEEYLTLRVTFCFARTAGMKKKKLGYPIQTNHGDLDNLVKQLLDSIMGIVLMDDRSVVSIHANKILGDADSCAFTIEPLQPGDIDAL